MQTKRETVKDSPPATYIKEEYMFRAAGKRLFRNGKNRRRTFFSERELSFSEIGQLFS